jgi:serine protease Do
MKLKKSIIASVALVCVGIIFGVVLVSSYSGIRWGFAQDTKIGAQNPPVALENLKAMSDGYVAIAKGITPKVVMIEVVSKSERPSGQMKDFFKYFGIPDDERERDQAGMGSGVIISEDGYILTNNHVVKDAIKDNIKVITYDRKEYYAKFIGGDKNTDLAVIKIDAGNLPVAYLGNSDEVQVGQLVFAVGNPLGKVLSSTVTHGIVSAIGRNIGIIQPENTRDRSSFAIEEFIQTDATINPGNSGGPLVDVTGAVIGINTAIVTGTNQGYGFAIPISLAKRIADDIIKFGKVKRGYLGIQMDANPVDGPTAKALGLPKPYGVIINDIIKGQAAAEGGLKAKDIILEVDGKEIFSSNQVQDLVGRKHPGDEVNLKIYRIEQDKEDNSKPGKTFNITLKLKALNENASISENESTDNDESPESDNSKNSVSFDKIGMTVRNMSTAEKEKLNVSEGVLVEKTKSYGIADSRGIPSGSVILDVMKNGKTIKATSVSVVEKIIKNSKPGDALMFRIKTANGPFFRTIEIPKD